LTGMDVANASLYDGATAVAEAAMMAVVQTGRDKVLVAGYLHPEYEETLRGFAKGRKFHVLHHPSGAGVVDPGSIEKELHEGIAAVIFQQPNFLGLVEDAVALTAAAHTHGALAIACVDPINLAVLAAPGDLAYMGPDGLRSVAGTSLSRAHHLSERLAALPGFSPAFPRASFLSEFPLRVDQPDALLSRLSERGILGGLDAGRWFPEL